MLGHRNAWNAPKAAGACSGKLPAIDFKKSTYCIMLKLLE